MDIAVVAGGHVLVGVTPAEDRFEALSQVYSAIDAGVECRVHRGGSTWSSRRYVSHGRFPVDVTRHKDCACSRGSARLC